MEFSRYLETPRLILRPLLARDVLFFYRLFGNEQVREFLGGPVPWWQMILRFGACLKSPSTAGIWVVQTRQDTRPVGLIEVSPHKDGDDYEISYQFHPDHWGKGFAREAATIAILHSLSDPRLHRLIAETQSANRASCRLLKHLGMEELRRVERFGEEQIIFVI